MKMLMVAILLAVATVPAHAQRKPCEELKEEIAAKVRKNGVKHYTLLVVPNGEATDGQVVGSCDGGTKKIVYRPGAPAPGSAQ